jgi:hypothetical protein
MTAVDPGKRQQQLLRFFVWAKFMDEISIAHLGYIVSATNFTK